MMALAEVTSLAWGPTSGTAAVPTANVVHLEITVVMAARQTLDGARQPKEGYLLIGHVAEILVTFARTPNGVTAVARTDIGKINL
jgi:hypothetical protein